MQKAEYGAVEAFRRHSSRTGGSARVRWSRHEWCTVIGLSLLVGLGPWMLGSMRLLPQLILFGISLLTFIQLFIPSNPRDEAPRMHMRSLLRFPLFWVGGLLLVYIIIQGLNPAYRVEYKDVDQWQLTSWAWSMVPVNHIDWLPSGVSAPYEHGSAWRALVNWAAVIMGIWSAWVGLKRRSCVEALFWVICINGSVIALVGVLQQMTGSDTLLWTFASSNKNFFGPFHYRNHAGAYLYPILTLCLGMFFYYSRRARRRMQRSHPGIVFLLLGLLIVVAQTMNGSRGAFLMSVGALLVFILLFFVRILSSGSFRSMIAGIVVLLLVLATGGFAVVRFGDLPAIEKRFESLRLSDRSGLTKDASANMRVLMSQATAEMYLDRPVWGWGAGSYRWAIRHYQLMDKYRLLWVSHNLDPENGLPYARIIIHGHNDILEFAAELGAVGGGLLVLIILFWGGAVLYYWRALECEHLMILSGAGLALIHATFEFNLSNPSILLLVSTVTAATVTWMRLHPRFQPKEDAA
ncbi:O-antigen ligase family protein [Ruficoccus sp. ZRK36]|uniref:O-antigen ligase family protein n=1 Tax=Ruficoccus sp. ZRK36 TaxID=2866311 RepID=UPI001C73681B|nr:O-antigen ligase family protein [Ruficoccus sp. ZRK36]QYY36559.1 O-antigen ligase family protein [Ruficoccus sp. ZRK36]